jgi:hypothetical protein
MVKMKKRIGFLLGIAAMAVFLAFGALTFFGPDTAQATHGGTGNGAPNGAHYNLNIIGVPKDKTADMTGNNGHRIFVKLDGVTKIWLCEAGVDAGCLDVDGYRVLDANGTDGSALFALPNPDPTNSGTTSYSVFARALGKPGGKADMTTCFTDASGTFCSVIVLELERDKGQSKFDNVSKYLLYVYLADGTRVPLFSGDASYFWDYDNDGLKLAQLRFYQCATAVPAGTDPTGGINDIGCFSGTH